jgi:hypothetical protein
MCNQEIRSVAALPVAGGLDAGILGDPASPAPVLAEKSASVSAQGVEYKVGKNY